MNLASSSIHPSTSNMELHDLVPVFNTLERKPKTPSGAVDNHWQFAVKHVPLEPPGDLLHLVNPGSRYNHTEGPAQIPLALSAAARADIVMPLLLKAFVYSMGNKHEVRFPPYAPWSWGTDDEELAKALEKRLKSVGVREELCVIRIGDEKNIQIECEEWAVMSGMVKAHTEPNCAKCSTTGEEKKLQYCSRCKMAQYCSKECQKADWKTHKIVCNRFAHGTNSRHGSIDPVEYYGTIAPNMPDAQALAREIGLALPGRGGIQLPIRRLVITGKDSPENIAKFLGDGDRDLIAKIHQETRIEVLLRPPPGSPNYAVATSLDQNCPAWTPRAAVPSEEAEIKKVRDMQALVRRHMGSRSMASINTTDMQAILVENFRANWSEMLPYYQTAVNTMDQGVNIRYEVA